MRKIEIAKMLFWIVIVFWVAETWWFGWNDKPINEYEKMCDCIVQFGLGLSVFLYFSTIFRWIEKKISEDESK